MPSKQEQCLSRQARHGVSGLVFSENRAPEKYPKLLGGEPGRSETGGRR